jgi:hypothetical protein
MQKDFSKQLIKGKIAEMVFDQMFRKVGVYTVIPFGYEAIIPELMQYADQSEQRELINNIRSAPDFALVQHSPKQVMLIEVKYRSKIDMLEIQRTAGYIQIRWKLVWLFVATPEGFYLDSCADIAEQGRLTPLEPDMVPQEVQDEFLALIRDFIRS